MTNYRAPSFDPKTGLFIVDAHPSYSIYFAKPQMELMDGQVRTMVYGAKGSLRRLIIKLENCAGPMK